MPSKKTVPTTAAPATPPTPPPPAKATKPNWHLLAEAAYRASTNTFILAGPGVSDYMVPVAGSGARAYFAKTMVRADTVQSVIVVYYDRDGGIEFATPQMETLARNIVKTTNPAPQAAAGNAAQALARQALASGNASASGDDGAPPRSPLPAFTWLERLMKTAGRRPNPADPEDAKLNAAQLGQKYPYSGVRVILVVEHADAILPDAPMSTLQDDKAQLVVKLQKWSRDPILSATRNMVFFCVSSAEAIHAKLRSSDSRWMVINVPLPDYDVRREFIQWYLDRRADRFTEVKVEVTAESMAALTAGMSLMAIEDIMLRAIVGNALTRDLILAMKTAYFAQEFEGGLTVVDPSFGFENTTGLDRVNEWAKEEIIQPMREARWPDVTPGALLCGSTGLGKTWWASALAYEAGVPMVRLDPERMQSSLVGSTEARIAKMLGVIEANWPCILFVDEVDQSDIAARGNESGNPVAKNMFAMFLRWMGRPEIQGRIVVLMATNRPDLLDPAFVRRLGNVIPFVPYNEQGRAGVVRTQARIQGVGITDEAVTYLAAASRNYSGADLKLVVEKARKLARRAGHTGIELADAEQAFRVIRPVSLKPIDRNGTLAVNFYTTLALNAATDLSLVPDDSEWQDATAPETIVARLSTMDGAFRDTRDDWTVN